ncbi:MAG: 23S rRNA (uracil(1939)-C(5))-methyltransferase RlmD [Candidatus Cloacimonetes bacterium]|nr:23S rRNA (uracil(1939)-C(5))-methyltransferase RlmD [Candidatus Cloacimonadota bacterium]
MNDIFIVTIEKIVYQGYGLAHHDGRTVFVLNGIPEDVLEVKLEYKKKESLFCKILKIIEPSKYRLSEKVKGTALKKGERFVQCSKIGLCGGCDWVNVEYDAQIMFKETIFREIFRNNTLKIDKSPDIFFYRNKNFMPVCSSDDCVNIGLYTRQTHSVVEHDFCYLYPQILKDITEIIKNWLITYKVNIYDEKSQKNGLRHIGYRTSSDLKSILVIFVTSKKIRLDHKHRIAVSLTSQYPQIKGIVQNIQNEKTNVILGNSDETIFGVPYLSDKMEDIVFRIHYKAFYQVNSKQALNVYNDILNWVNKNDLVIDAYCGIGSIGLFVARKAKKVYCIDENEESIKSGIYNAKINLFNNVSFIHGKIENTLEKVINNEFLKSENQLDTIIFDPPRTGLLKEIVTLVTSKKIHRIIYMSCNLSTQYRDVQIFCDYGYKIVFIKGYDMFPHTWHIESLVVLELIER